MSVKLNNCLDPNSGNERHSSWSKLLSTRKVLHMNYDYVIYIDSDCIFKDFIQPLESLLIPDKDVTFFNNNPWNKDKPCAGFYICKVQNSTKKFIDDWYNFTMPTRDVEHAWEQDALWEIYQKYNIGIIDAWMFEERKGQFLRHVSSYNESEVRMPYFSKFIDDNNINFEINIVEINIIDYDTAAGAGAVGPTEPLNI